MPLLRRKIARAGNWRRAQRGSVARHRPGAKILKSKSRRVFGAFTITSPNKLTLSDMNTLIVQMTYGTPRTVPWYIIIQDTSGSYRLKRSSLSQGQGQAAHSSGYSPCKAIGSDTASSLRASCKHCMPAGETRDRHQKASFYLYFCSLFESTNCCTYTYSGTPCCEKIFVEPT